MRYGAGYLWVTFETEDEVARIGVRTRRLETASAGNRPAQVAVAGSHVYVVQPQRPGRERMHARSLSRSASRSGSA